VDKMAKALGLVRAALDAVKNALGTGDGARSDVPTRPQLEQCMVTLEAMQFALERGELPRAGERETGMGRSIADGWPLESEVGVAIIAAERAYLDV